MKTSIPNSHPIYNEFVLFFYLFIFSVTFSSFHLLNVHMHKSVYNIDDAPFDRQWSYLYLLFHLKCLLKQMRWYLNAYL